jgi:tRNA (cytosine38-C5)-methyltransferase
MEFDLVGSESRLSACFTKSYKRYFLGTGSVLIENHEMLSQFNDSQSNSLKWVQEVLKPRFFTTREILRLMSFPEWFTFPSGVTEKQASALLGNSINIHVVALLIGLLIDE